MNMINSTWAGNSLQAHHYPVLRAINGSVVAQTQRHASADGGAEPSRDEIVDGVMRFIDVINDGEQKNYPDNAPIFCIINKRLYNNFRSLFEWFYFFEPVAIKAHAMTFSGRIGKVLLQELDYMTASDLKAIKQKRLATDAVTAQINSAETLEEKFLICASIEPILLKAQKAAKAYTPRTKPEHWHPAQCWRGDSRYLGLKDKVDRYVGWEARHTVLSTYDAYRAVKDYLFTLVCAQLSSSSSIAEHLDQTHPRSSDSTLMRVVNMNPVAAV